MPDIKLARAIALATRADPVEIGGPGTLRLAAALEQVPERLIERLTAEELANVKVAIALLVWAAVSGVRLGRAPRQAWWLAVAGSGGWFAAVLLLDVLLLMQGLLGLAWSGTLPLMVHAMLTAIGMLLVVIALAAGLPARPAEEDGVGE